jgi:hypothetical protein
MSKDTPNLSTERELKLKKQNQDLKLENRRLKQRDTRHAQQANSWKKKAQDQGKKNIIFKKALRLHGIDPECISGTKPARHSYSSLLMALSIFLNVSLGLSYRQTQNAQKAIFSAAGIKLKIPCKSTIRVWVLKLAFSRLNFSEPITDRMIAIIDESISIGQEKMFLVLGVSLDKWLAEPSALCYADIKVLYVGSKTSWTGEDVSEALSKANKRVSTEFEYICSDGSSNLIKGIRLFGKPHVYDIAHKMGIIVEKRFSKDDAFILLQANLGKRRSAMMNSVHTALAPPKMRTKARYMNLFATTKWMVFILNRWDQLSQEQKDQVQFVKDNEPLVRELAATMIVVISVSKQLKKDGITKYSSWYVRQVFSNLSISTSRLELIEVDILRYISETESKLPNDDSIICSSDIIESVFGKAKRRLNNTSSSGLTLDMISTTLFTQEVKPEEVKTAFEKYRMADVVKWETENMVVPLGRLRRDFKAKLASLP